MLVVQYTGESSSLYRTLNSPKNLEVGCQYMVERIEIHPFHTEYSLLGVDGYYNSVWFDIVGEKPGTTPTEKKFMYMMAVS